MNFRVLCVPMILVFAGIISPAHADNAKERVQQAVQALVNSPAYRMVAAYDLHGAKLGIVTLECVRPDMMDLRYEEGGHITRETIAIGRKVYLRQGTDGKFRKVLGDGAAILSRMQSGSLQTFKAFSSIALVGHQTLHGESTSVYRLTGELAGVHSNTELWISDKTHLPLKADALATRELKHPDGQITQQHVVTTFTYSLSSGIVPPSFLR